jgi:hypothetical protein
MSLPDCQIEFLVGWGLVEAVPSTIHCRPEPMTVGFSIAEIA